MKTLATVLVLVFGYAASAGAQTSANTSIAGTFASFRGADAAVAPRQDVAATAAFEHRFNSEQGRVYYDLDGGTFDSSGDWSYYLHTGGFTYRFGGADAADRRLYVNASAVLRKNGDAWAAADYSAIGGGLNAEFHPRAGVTLRTGYRTDYRSFDDMSALTQFEQRGFASAHATLETRTTLISEIQVGGKSYDGQVPLEPMVITAPVDITTLGPGQGRGMGPALRETTWLQPQTQSQSGTAGLVSGLFRVAQSLSDRTGVHAQVFVRATFGAVPPGLVTTPAGFFDDGVYDDPYASDATAGQGGLTRAFGSGAQLEALVSYANRRYTSTPAVDSDWNELPGSPLRHDHVWRGAVVWSQPILAKRTGKADLMLDIAYRFMDSRSNDAFYSYTSHGVGLGLSIGY